MEESKEKETEGWVFRKVDQVSRGREGESERNTKRKTKQKKKDKVIGLI